MRNESDEPELNSFECLLNAEVKYDMCGTDAKRELDCADVGMN